MNPTRLEAINHCLRMLTTAISTASLYNAGHPQVGRLCAEARERLGVALAEDSDISLMRIDDKLAVNGHPLSSSLYVDRFARLMKAGGVGHIKFLRDVTTGELLELVEAMARRDTTIRSSAHLRLGQVEVRYKGAAGLAELGEKAAEILGGVSGEELAKIMEVYASVSQSRKLHVVGLSEIVAEFVDIFASYSDPLLALVPLRSMDEYTFTHSLNVCLLNIAQAGALGIEGPLLHDIGLSAILHDIGKLFVPEEILNKADKLERQEWEILKTHAVKGAEYLVKTPGVPRMAVVSAYEHHMRYDQLGYPIVPRPWQQNLCSHMTAISDVFDALRTRRPYRQPMEVDEALDHIAHLGGRQLHPQLTQSFVGLMRRVHAA